MALNGELELCYTESGVEERNIGKRETKKEGLRWGKGAKRTRFL